MTKLKQLVCHDRLGGEWIIHNICFVSTSKWTKNNLPCYITFKKNVFAYFGTGHADQLGELLQEFHQEFLGFPQNPRWLSYEETKEDTTDDNLISDLA